MGPGILSDGRCSHCLTQCMTGGCPTCSASLTFCTCGALLACGCGATFEHEPSSCPNVVMPRVVMLPPLISFPNSPIFVEAPWNLS